MLSSSIILSTLIFSALSYILLSLLSSNSMPKKKKLKMSILMLVVCGMIKVTTDCQLESLTNLNHYKVLQISKQANSIQIMKAFKKYKKLNIQKESASADQEEVKAQQPHQFEQIKKSHSILSDETKRDIYNRFGNMSLEIDPRKDELLLITNIIVVYIFWGAVTFIMTLPKAFRECRVWSTIILVVMLVLDVIFRLTEIALPSWFSNLNYFNATTENDMLSSMYSVYPIILSLLCSVGVYLYVDTDQSTILLIEEIIRQKNIGKNLLHESKDLLLQNSNSNSKNDVDTRRISEFLQKNMYKSIEKMQHSSFSADTVIENLKNGNSNPLASYYWLIFVTLYGVVHFVL